MKTKLGKKGFTLVEIMIVVAIIGLLAAIAIPNLLRARINANDSAVQGDLRAFSTAAESYRAAQQPPVYGTVALMTAAAPPYLDATWTDAAFTKHGHTFGYTLPAGGATYTMQAAFIANQSVNTYCVDHSGVLRVMLGGVAAGQAYAAGTACGGNAVQ